MTGHIEIDCPYLIDSLNIGGPPFKRKGNYLNKRLAQNCLSSQGRNIKMLSIKLIRNANLQKSFN